MDGAGQISRDPRTKRAVQTLGTRLAETCRVTVASESLAILERMRGIFLASWSDPVRAAVEISNGAQHDGNV